MLRPPHLTAHLLFSKHGLLSFPFRNPAMVAAITDSEFLLTQVYHSFKINVCICFTDLFFLQLLPFCWGILWAALIGTTPDMFPVYCSEKLEISILGLSMELVYFGFLHMMNEVWIQDQSQASSAGGESCWKQKSVLWVAYPLEPPWWLPPSLGCGILNVGTFLVGFQDLVTDDGDGLACHANISGTCVWKKSGWVQPEEGLLPSYCICVLVLFMQWSHTTSLLPSVQSRTDSSASQGGWMLDYVEISVLVIRGGCRDLAALGASGSSCKRGKLLCGGRFFFHSLSFSLAYG